MRPQASASLTSDVEVTPTLSADNTLTANVTGDGAKITANSSDGGRDFLNLAIDIKRPRPHGTWEGHLKIAYEDTGSGNGVLEVVSGTASSGSSTSPTVPTTGSAARTPDTPASGFMKFDWDGNGFNRFEIRTKTDEEWNLAYTDSEGSMTEEHINKHDFTLTLENTYKSEGDVESSLTTTGDVDASGTGSASNKRFVDYKSNDRVLHTFRRLHAQPSSMISEIRIIPDHERHANYTKTIESSANFDASRDPQLVVNPPSISGISRVNVNGHHRVHVLPSHQDSSLDYHDGADMNLADGSGMNYGDSHWNQTWPITVDPNYDPRNDFEKSLQAAVDAAVLELTSGSESSDSAGGSCSSEGDSGAAGSLGGSAAEGEDPPICFNRVPRNPDRCTGNWPSRLQPEFHLPSSDDWSELYHENELGINVILGVAGVFVEPLDWAVTGYDIYSDPYNGWAYAGLIPIIPAGVGRAGHALSEAAAGANKLSEAVVKAADLPWARAGAARAAKAIEAGESSIKVASRDDAVELVWRMFSSRGFLNTTGRTGSDVRKIAGSKACTYHWDDVLDAAGNVAGHGADNAHAAMRHVQVHLENGDIIRIFFP